jgi:Uma2 family endonuclease
MEFMSISMEERGPQRHRITVDEYYRMAEVGLLAPDARVELIEGEIIDMAPIGMEHGWVVDRLTHLLVTTIGTKGFVRVQGAVRLSQWSQPQPDLVILAPRSDYRTRHPSGADSLLVIEVSDTTVRYDLNVKTPLYARHGVPEVWIMDLPKRRLHVFGSLAGDVYTETRTHDAPGKTAITAVPGLFVDLSPILLSS